MKRTHDYAFDINLPALCLPYAHAGNTYRVPCLWQGRFGIFRTRQTPFATSKGDLILATVAESFAFDSSNTSAPLTLNLAVEIQCFYNSICYYYYLYSL